MFESEQQLRFHARRGGRWRHRRIGAALVAHCDPLLQVQNPEGMHIYAKRR